MGSLSVYDLIFHAELYGIAAEAAFVYWLGTNEFSIGSYHTGENIKWQLLNLGINSVLWPISIIKYWKTGRPFVVGRPNFSQPTPQPTPQDPIARQPPPSSPSVTEAHTHHD